MQELSMHILDIAHNSIKAGADTVEISVDEQPAKNTLEIAVKDNGCGMSEEFLKRVKDPFTTTRTTRKAGLGIPLFEAAAVQTGGHLDIESKQGRGTVLKACFVYDSIDRAPLGDIKSTLITLISGYDKIRFIYKHIVNEKEFVLDTAEIQKAVGDIPLNTPEILAWIGGFIEEGIGDLVN
mgnify:CR=1 FL=1